MNMRYVDTVPAALQQFSPRVLKCSIFSNGMNYPKGYRLKDRYVFDYELEFFTDSAGFMVIDDHTYLIRKGDIVFRRPGQYAQGIMPYRCYIICIDLLDNTGKNQKGYDLSTPQEFQNDYINPVLEAIPPVFHPAREEKYLHLFDTVHKEFISPGESSPLVLKALVLQILHELYMDVKNPVSSAKFPLSSHYSSIRRVTEYIEKNYNQPLNLGKLAALSGLSPCHFHTVFTKTLGYTPNGFVTKARLEKAKELLTKTALPISHIAEQCGFENIPYFSYVFKKQIKVTPGEFRKQYRYL